MPITDKLRQEIQTLQQEGLYRKPIVQDDFAECVNFSSNDYLSLRNDVRIQEAFQIGFARNPAGAGASMVVAGYHKVHQEFEALIAKQLEVDKALLCQSGFTANLSIMALFAKLRLHLLVDKAVHASIYDGIRLAGGQYSRFLHQDGLDLEKKIPLHANNQVVITEGIFSMSGHAAPLKTLANLANHHETALFVDEAHSFGVLGPHGLGAVAANGLSQEEVPLRMISFGKALGAQGAVIAGKAEWIDVLIQVARPYIYSTGMSPALTYGLMESLSILFDADERRQKLWQLVNYFRIKVKNSPLQWRASKTPIQQLQLGCPHKALDFAEKLKKSAIYCLPMRAPTVNLQETGLRIVLNYNHSFDDINNLFFKLHSFY